MGVVNMDQGWAFVHVPKTGGTSIAQVLRGMPGAVTTDDTHMPRCLFPPGMKTFGFVRNPWALLVSRYSFLSQKKMQASDNFDQGFIREQGFKRWLMEGQYFNTRDLKRKPKPEQPLQRRTQMYWLDGCDAIGKTECMAEDFAAICEWLGLPRAILPRANRSRHHDYREYYDAESREFVAEWFAPEIKNFGYTFN